MATTTDVGGRLEERHVKRWMPEIVKNLPSEWKGTTFRNAELLGREEFCERLSALILAKEAAGASTISAEEIESVGNAEDYLRVASNVSTTLELLLAVRRGLAHSQVFCFSSRRMPVVAVALTAASRLVHLHAGADWPRTDGLVELLALLGCTLVYHDGPAQPHGDDGVVLAVCNDDSDDSTRAWADDSGVDGVVGPSVLYIRRPERISVADVLVMRKRMAIPMTTPAALALIERTCGSAAAGDSDAVVDAAALAGFHAHLQQLCGTPACSEATPVVCTAGLSTLAALFTALITAGGVDVLMCATAYGGSSQLTDIMTQRAGPSRFRKHTFEAAGRVDVNASIAERLAALAERPADALLPVLLLFVEVPTNPDMKVPDLAALVAAARSYHTRTGQPVLLLVDTTFAPCSQVLRQLRELDEHLPAMVFVSMSKAVSRGHTVSGALVANHTDRARATLAAARRTAALFDNQAAADQLRVLAAEHTGVESRCQLAYAAACSAGAALRQAVHDHCAGFDMSLQFVTEEQAARGFSSPTFSFNLPSPAAATPEINAALAQRFVDLITRHHRHFKPCVSFGQDNGLVYATVPATSTQGAIKEEDKAKQAVGGVQLVRLSFPPTLDIDTVNQIMRNAVAELYA